MTTEAIKKHILDLEIAALERWNAGDPDGFLAIYADEITYFDPFQPKRIDGLAAMTELYNGLRGGVAVECCDKRIDGLSDMTEQYNALCGGMAVKPYELIDPQVAVSGTTAVLSYNLRSWAGGMLFPWNCTEIYRREPDGVWKIVHSHWSIIRPMDLDPAAMQ